MINGNTEPASFRNFDQARNFGGTHNLICDQDVLEPVFREDFRLADFGASEADSLSRSLLFAGKCRALIILEMRPQLARFIRKKLSEQLDVALAGLPIQQQGRCVKIFDRLTDE
jgi:hypothetical protein